ncbi:hypothetical protein L798_06968 [Zootermopsis nevadensis]|uniref:Uncharacterized protein n=1 Tax=Zootermopsis nevadensis TaxID=136037 RepID=A0A067R504_ZOONE|nr:hypothetical protein L798_06968 [Zootermopsis nevadensis]
MLDPMFKAQEVSLQGIYQVYIFFLLPVLHLCLINFAHFLAHVYLPILILCLILLLL